MLWLLRAGLQPQGRRWRDLAEVEEEELPDTGTGALVALPCWTF